MSEQLIPARCTEECWTPVPCPECGRDLPPRGRSAPLGSVSQCCDEHRYDEANKRHLWSETDDERWRFYPDEAPGECGACGSRDDVKHRGWTDEGDPMMTCAKCGAPDVELARKEQG